MKTVHFTEFGYALVWGGAGCLVAGPLGVVSYRTFSGGSHDALLGRPFAIAALLLGSRAAWCCGWELLLQMRRWEPGRSEALPLVVFCSGLLTLFLALTLAISL